MTDSTDHADYQEAQDIYLKWHDGRRPLSGFVKELINWRDAAVIAELEAILEAGDGDTWDSQMAGSVGALAKRYKELKGDNIWAKK